MQITENKKENTESKKQAGIHFSISEDKRKKFKRKAEDNGTTMKDLLINFVDKYIGN